MNDKDSGLIEDHTIEKVEDYRRRKITSVLTIVFTDIAQSTYLREQLGEVAYEQLREEHDETVQKIVESDDAGAVIKSTGDGALAIFSEPSTSIERCLNIQQEMLTHKHFKLRIGVDMGQVSLKSKGGVVKDVFGRHVNRAARIQALAEPGHILTSFHVFDCAIGWLRGSDIKWHNHGLAELKGFAEPISIHEAYHPFHLKPQSNKSFPTKDIGKTHFSMIPTEYLPVNNWGQIFDSLRDNPIEIYIPESVSLDDPISFYTDSISNTALTLNGLLPEPISSLWVGEFPNNHLMEQQFLEDAGCKIDFAFTSEEAHEKLSQKTYTLIVTDIGSDDNLIATIRLLTKYDILSRFIYMSSQELCQNSALLQVQAMKQGAVIFSPTAGIISFLDCFAQVLEGILHRMPFKTYSDPPIDRTRSTPSNSKRLTLKEKISKLFYLLCLACIFARIFVVP